ncbi:hypothetical protein [Chondromyces apiculatus]|uniref:DUF883 domain-containing protein n=1 Tax=Chondromyces apiculatus DSM 436 TaxID=1192034 RepID=A0A017SWW3_9BACT|nr:hypothetical protein [Chondromyces apiculatus]EYF01453.1 Hypothetical protein CAP_8286 [Chondromyces apiculatus DSM 436]
MGQKLLEMAPVVPRAIEKARRADEKLVAFVQERPVTSLCVAAFAGYLLGRVLTRIG